ncbi:hypothetical protein F6456_02060 [Streptomyces sp. LBUM 1484]|nr:hypothetical protein [Streptomyces sp. LBUM 1484]
MSVDLVGTMYTPVPLDGLVLAAEETSARLLGLTTAPVIDVIADRRIEQGGWSAKAGVSPGGNGAPS